MPVPPPPPTDGNTVPPRLGADLVPHRAVDVIVGATRCDGDGDSDRRAGRPRPARRAWRSRSRGVRLTRLAVLVARRCIRRVALRLTLFSGWVWVAAASLVGFEMLDMIVVGMLAAPEVLPLVLLSLAAVWAFRRALRRVFRRVRRRLASALRRR